MQVQPASLGCFNDPAAGKVGPCSSPGLRGHDAAKSSIVDGAPTGCCGQRGSRLRRLVLVPSSELLRPQLCLGPGLGMTSALQAHPRTFPCHYPGKEPALEYKDPRLDTPPPGWTFPRCGHPGVGSYEGFPPGGTSGKKEKKKKKKKPACQCRRRKRCRFNPLVGIVPTKEEGHGNPLQYPCLENPMDRGARQATVHREAESWT